MKAILIARVSTEEQREAGNSLPAQVVRLERYCHSKGFLILKTCSFDESAYTDQRDEFDRIIDYILAQKEKIAVCCDKVDRISRNIFDTRISKLYEKALRDELELHFISDGQIITSRISAAEKFQFSINLGLAKYYSDAISDNVKRAQEQKIRMGDWLFKAPYGYKNITKPDGKADIVVDEYMAAIIKKIFDWYATKAYSTDLISQKLKTDYNLDWGKGYVARILSNPFYHGEMIVKGKLYPHRYPPLVSKALFDEVAQVKAGFNKKPIKFAGLPYMYRGLFRCADCGLAITPEKHKGHVYYHCTQHKGKHGAKWVREEVITEQLGQIFKKIQMPEAVIEQITNTLSSTHRDKIEFHNMHLDKLTQEQKMVTKMMDNLYWDKLKGKIAEIEYDRHYQKLREQMASVNASIERLQNAENNYFITAKYLLELSRRAYDLFIGSEIEEKRQLMKLVFQNLRLEGELVRFDALKPFDLILNSADGNQWWAHQGSNLGPLGYEPIALTD
jgi:site-specific DNA recombinase